MEDPYLLTKFAFSNKLVTALISVLTTGRLIEMGQVALKYLSVLETNVRISVLLTAITSSRESSKRTCTSTTPKSKSESLNMTASKLLEDPSTENFSLLTIRFKPSSDSNFCQVALFIFNSERLAEPFVLRDVKTRNFS